MDWKALLDELNSAILGNLKFSAPDVINGGFSGSSLEKQRYQRVIDAACEGLAGTRRWFGFPGATEEEISEREVQLGVVFPESYREFLKTSNGFIIPGSFNGPLLPVAEVALFGQTNPWICDMWLRECGAPDFVPERRLHSMIRASSTGWSTSDYLLVEPMPPPAECSATAYHYWRLGADPFATFADVIASEIRCQHMRPGT